jgi:MFS family permease
MSHDNPGEQAFKSNILRLYMFQALANFSLWMPIWIVFFEVERGLTLEKIYLIAGIGWIVMVVADIPAGALADAFGRKAVVLSGTALFTAGLAVLALVGGLYGVAAGYLLYMVGQSLVSGTDTTLLYESVKLAGRQDEYARIQSNSFQIIQGSQAVSSILGGVLAYYRLWLPMLITAGLSAIAMVVMTTVKEPPVIPSERKGYFAALRSSGSYLRENPRATSLLSYAALLAGTAFFVPFVLFQPEMSAHAIAVGWFGLMFTGLRAASLLGLRYGVKVIRPENFRQTMAAIPVLLTALFLGVAVSPNWWTAYLAMLVLSAVGAAYRPSAMDLLNRLVPSGIRATLLSTQNVVMTLFIAVMHPVVGGVADAWGLKYAFVLLAGFSLLPLIAVGFLRRETRATQAPATESPVRAGGS